MSSAGQRPLRVAFAGTPQFAAVALQAIHDAGFAIPVVLTQPDRPAGRGMKLQPSPVKALAQALGCPVIQPRGLRLDGRFPEDAADVRSTLLAASPDVMVVAAYGLILPVWCLTLPRLGCLNIHASLLPRWRGAAPIHRAIEAGDRETGITVMQMDQGLDTGAMLSIAREPVAADDSTGTLHDRLARLGGREIVEALRAAGAGRLEPHAQPESGVCYAHKIDKSQSLIDWRDDAVQIERRVRAFDPFPGASFQVDGETIKLWRAECLPGNPAPAGTVVEATADRLVVACGSGSLRLIQVQRPGGKRVPAAALLQARPGLLGRVMGYPGD